MTEPARRARTRTAGRGTTGRRRVAVLLGLLTALVAALQLLVPSAIGLADNGDYTRLTCQLHLQPDVAAGAPARFTYWVPTFRPEDPGAPRCVGLFSTQLPLLRVARVLSPGDGVLDLRVVGLLHALLLGALVAAVVLALPGSPRLRLLCGGLLAVVLLDTSRLVYLASAYSEPASLLGLLLLLATALWALRRPPGGLPSLLLCLAAVPLVLSKPQNVLVVGVVAVAVLLRQLQRPPARVVLASALAAVALLGTGLAALRSVPPELREPNTYNMVFFEVLRFSPDPAADARALGLDPELARWAGTNAFATTTAASDPAFAGFYDRVGNREIVEFYARRPGRALSLYARAARDSFTLLPDYLGTYPAGPGRAEFAQACRGCPITVLARAVRPAAPVLLPLLWLAAAAGALALLRRGRPDDAGLGGATLVLTGTTIVLFGTAVLGSGDYELVKHLYLPAVGSTLLLPLGLATVLRLRDRSGYLPVTGPARTGTGVSPGGSRTAR